MGPCSYLWTKNLNETSALQCNRTHFQAFNKDGCPMFSDCASLMVSAPNPRFDDHTDSQQTRLSTNIMQARWLRDSCQ